MAFDEYRDRRRFDLEDEFRGSDVDRNEFRGGSEGGSETRWPGESSWGYGREYDEGIRATPQTSQSPFESFEPEPRTTARRYEERLSRGIGWRPQGQYGESGGYLYGGQPGETFDQGVYGSTGLSGYGTGTSYGVSTHLAGIPRGRFTGRGPKGYQRSDERVREDVSEELAQSGEIDASEIEVRVVNCQVILEGEVGTREEKRLAEDIAEACPGVRDVENRIKVKKGFFARLFGTDEEEDREETYSEREFR